MIHYTHCPVCRQDGIQALFTAKDHTVSGKQFPVWTCRKCQALFTQDVPNESDIGEYYKSDSYISHSDTRKGLINRLYHFIRSITLQSKYKTVIRATGLRKGSILDIGCGTGAFAHTMLANGWVTTGLEPDEEARARARETYDVDARPSAELFNLPPAQFDAITMWHVLEHVHELHRYLDQINGLLKDRGKLFIAVPNHVSTDAATYQSYWAAYDVPRHLYHFSPASMRRLAEDHGLRVCQVLPMWFDSFYVSMLSEGYRQSKPAFLRPLRGAVHGLISNLVALANREKCSSLIYVIEKKVS